MPAMLLDWLNGAGLSAVKPFVTALLLPPLPWLLLALAGAWRARARPRTGGALVVLACAGLWLCACDGCAEWLERRMLREPPALGPEQRAQLAQRAAAGVPLAIVVLGGGVDRLAPEYGAPTLGNFSFARLRYGIWLGRATAIPLAASGGIGWGAPQDGTPGEATLMADIARTEFGAAIRWVEADSRDTRENAANTVALLKAAGIREIVLVTSTWHMPRALREFESAARLAGAPAMAISAAPMGIAYPGEQPLLRWMPSGDGAQRMRAVLREALAALVAGR